MPGRWLSLAIIASWLGTTGWLLWRDVWPRWRPNQPPPYTIDLIEEVTTAPRSKPRIRWEVSQNGQLVFRAWTWVERPQPEVFELKAEVKPPSGVEPEPTVAVGPARVLARRLESTYRVTQEGQLLGIEGTIEIARVEINVPLPGLSGPGLSADVTAHFSGEVRGGQFYSAVQLRSPLLSQEVKTDLKPVPVSSQGSVLLPLHPVSRIQGLRPGQEWRMAVMNPLHAALAATAKEKLRFQA